VPKVEGRYSAGQAGRETKEEKQEIREQRRLSAWSGLEILIGWIALIILIMGGVQVKTIPKGTVALMNTGWCYENGNIDYLHVKDTHREDSPTGPLCSSGNPCIQVGFRVLDPDKFKY